MKDNSIVPQTGASGNADTPADTDRDAAVGALLDEAGAMVDKIEGAGAETAGPDQDDPATWLTFDQALEHLKIREWLSRELAGVADATGWRISPGAVRDFIDGAVRSRIFDKLHGKQEDFVDEHEMTLPLADGALVSIVHWPDYGQGRLVAILTEGEGRLEIFRLPVARNYAVNDGPGLPGVGWIIGAVRAVGPAEGEAKK